MARLQQLLRSRVQVGDVALHIDRDDRLCEALEREVRTARARRRHHRHDARGGEFLRVRGLDERTNLSRLDDLDAGDQQRRCALLVDSLQRQLEATDLRLEADDLDFESLGRRLVVETTLQGTRDEFGKLRRNEICEGTPDQRVALHSDQCRELPIGEQDGVAVDQHDLVAAVGEVREEAGAGRLGPLRGFTRADEHAIQALRELLQTRFIALQIDAARQRAALRQQPLELIVDLDDAAELATLHPPQRKQQGRDDRQEQAQ